MQVNIDDQYRRYDTRKPAGCYVEFSREEIDDSNSTPLDWMDPEEDAERIADWRKGNWYFIGIRAKADITIVNSQGHATVYSLTSAGIWGIESDSGEEYLTEIFEGEAAELANTIKALGAWDGAS